MNSNLHHIDMETEACGYYELFQRSNHQLLADSGSKAGVSKSLFPPLADKGLTNIISIGHMVVIS